MSPAAIAYRAITTLSGPAIGWLLRWRARSGKEDPSRLAERWGYAGRPRPAGFLVWIHAASVGESLSALPVVALLARRSISVLVTTGTVTSATLLGRRLPEDATHQYLPVDQPAAVRRFLDHWRPDLALWIESELWPNLVREARRRGVTLVLLNGRMSARSARGWSRVRGFARDVLGSFSLVLAQDEAQAARLAALGAVGARSLGDLKAAAPAAIADPELAARVAEAAAGRPVWLAASTHPGEEAIVLDAIGRLRRRFPALLTILAPRHPARADSVANQCKAAGLRLARRSRGEVPDAQVDLWLWDTLGELAGLYPLVPVALIGGSLDPASHIGGHNPTEAAIAGTAILHGPDTGNAAAVTAALDRADAARLVTDAESLAAAAADLLADPAAAAAMGRRARRQAEAASGVLDAVMEALEPFLPPVGRAAPVDAHA